jgi:hypothetical protein
MFIGIKEKPITIYFYYCRHTTDSIFYLLSCKDTNHFGLYNHHPFIAPPQERNGGIKGRKKKLG